MVKDDRIRLHLYIYHSIGLKTLVIAIKAIEQRTPDLQLILALRRQPAHQKGLHVINLLIASRVLHATISTHASAHILTSHECDQVSPVGLERHVKPEIPQHLGRLRRQRILHQGIRVAVAHEHGRRLVHVAGRGEVRGEGLVQQQPGREAEDAGDLDGRGEAGEDAHGAALGEAAEDDAVGGDAGRDLVLDEAVEVGLGLGDARGVLVGAAAEGVDGGA